MKVLNFKTPEEAWEIEMENVQKKGGETTTCYIESISNID